MERHDFQGVSPTRQGLSGQVVAPKWHGRGTSMKSLNRPVTCWHGSLSAPRWIFFFFLPLDATHAGSWSLRASMVKRFFFLEATEWWWAIGIFWWPASFFFLASSGAILGVHVGVANARG